jgi:5-(aminomethyl)-3-furanmethanol phosphate kinase
VDAVIKVGGSLAETPEVLRSLCVELYQIAKEYAFVVVPGGGRFADAVREFDKKYTLPSVVSHRMAILAMDQYGLLLSHLIPESCCFNGFKEVKSIKEDKKVPVFLPSKLMFHDDSLEASWDVTSDSIAAYIAHRLDAERVILVTDVNGVFTKDPKKFGDAKLMSEVSVKELLSYTKRTSVDKFLPKYLSKNPIDCYVVNGKHPERIKAVLSGRKTICTQIVADAYTHDLKING